MSLQITVLEGGLLEGALLVTTVLCVLVNGIEVAAKAVRARFVMANSAEVGIAPRWIPYLAVVEGAGTAGLVAGLFGLPLIGLAAAAGLVVFFVVAVLVHVRARVFHNIAFPGLFLLLAAGSAAYFALVPT
ncbi:DoxX family protein [Nocardiopsis oceani]